MSDSQGSIGSLVAACTFSAANPPAITSRYGVTGVVRNAQGDWTVTLSNQIDTTDRVVLLTSGTVLIQVAVNSVNNADSTVGILGIDSANAAQDAIVHMAVFRTAVG